MKMYKRFLAGLMAISLAAPLTAVNASALEPPRPKGDINYDGVFNLADTVMFRQWLHGNGKINDSTNADMNDDASLDIYDFIEMRKLLLGGIADANKKYENSGTVNLCGGIESAHPDGKKVDESFTDAQTEFSLELFKHTIKEDKNVLISPYSVSMALGMTANGAAGQTKADMEKALGGLEIGELNKYLKTWRTGQPNKDNLKIKTANSIWVRDNEALIKPQPTFIQDTVNYYGADIFKAAFDQSTVNDINDWINEHTDEMIPEILKELKPTDMMALINAVTFDAKWSTPYDDYQVKPHKFTAYDGSVKETDMLYGMESSYIQDEDAVGMIKHYEGGRYAFAAILPDEDITVTDFVNNLTAERLHKMFSEQHYADVETILPKFKYESSSDLNDPLKDMGMESAFLGTADFSKMVTPDSIPLYISSVKHKTFIDLNESGTTAAAATIVLMAGNGIAPERERKEVILDRPFVYAIVDTETDLPLFMGTVMDIE
ncbi:MAG: serpin family protein [Ruminococcus flavefaciens]